MTVYQLLQDKSGQLINNTQIKRLVRRRKFDVFKMSSKGIFPTMTSSFPLCQSYHDEM